MRNGGAAHKNQKRRGVYMVALPEGGISVTSHSRHLIPSH